MTTINAWAALTQGAPLEPFAYDPGPLGRDDVEIEVIACGICHSDLSMLANDWEMTTYPFVPGHEVTGRIAATGEGVEHLRVGAVVGLGWFSHTCGTCPQCMGGDHNLCPTGEGTIVGRHGGFADRVRCHKTWAIPLPDGVDPKEAGPLFCGGLTVFNPILQFGVLPTHRVGVVGIGGLGHLALRFLHAWGCAVTAFTSSDAKADEARRLGAHDIVDSTSDAALDDVAGRFDFIVSTVNVNLNWEKYLAALAPKGRLHVVGAVPEPIPVAAFPMILGQKSISGSPVGSPTTTTAMLDFCARHEIAPVTEHFPMERVNDAFAHLHSGKVRYRIVLDRA